MQKRSNFNSLSRAKGLRFARPFFFALLALTGCATIYQQEGIFTNGYSDRRLSQDTFVITFRANEFTDPDTVYEYALKRCKKITLKQGYRYFSILEHDKIDYPSIRLIIQCYSENPLVGDVFDAREHIL